MKPNLAILLIAISLSSCTNDRSDHLLENLMRKYPEKFGDILQNRDRYEIQVVYTQIDRDASNTPHFRTYYFNVDSAQYFYPASTVKLPMVLLALEKLRKLNIPGLDPNTIMLHDSVFSGQSRVIRDTTSGNGLPSVAHYSKKILVVSDNDAFNRLYEFVGQEQTNDILRRKGYRNTRIVHRLERPLSREENRHTEAVRFMSNGTVIYHQPGLVSGQVIQVETKVLKGKGYMKNDSLVSEPFDFTYKNFYPLTDQQELLKSIVFPESVSEDRRFEITEEDRQFVLKYMSQLPRETEFPPYYSDTTYYDAYCKFLLFGNGRSRIPESIRIFNKVGDAYGYLLDNAYVVDFENKVEFMLSAVINTNTDSIYNDGKYEYETLGFPFMRDLGQIIYQHELGREKKFDPDLSAYAFSYDR